MERVMHADEVKVGGYEWSRDSSLYITDDLFLNKAFGNGGCGFGQQVLASQGASLSPREYGMESRDQGLRSQRCTPTTKEGRRGALQRLLDEVFELLRLFFCSFVFSASC